MKKTTSLVLPSMPNEYYNKFVGEGMIGKCYLTEEGQLFKEFLNKRNDYQVLKMISESFDSKHLAFPSTFIFLEDDPTALVAYLREYIQGYTFDKLPYSVKMEEFIKSLNDFEKDLYENTRRGLEYRDMHAKNMIYRPDNIITAIDTESFDYSYEDTKMRIIDSLYELYYTICGEMLNCSMVADSQAQQIINRASKIGYQEFLRTSQMLEKLIEYLEKNRSCKIETYGDLKQNLVLRKG